MKRILFYTILTVILSIFLTGCGSLLAVTETKPKPIPMEPTPEVKLTNSVQKSIDFGKRTLTFVYANGADPYNPGVKQAEEYLAEAQSFIGVPPDPITVNVVETSNGRSQLAATVTAEKEIKRLTGLIQNYRDDIENYKAALNKARLAAMGVEDKTELSSGWLRWFSGLSVGTVILVIAGIIALFVLFPQVMVVFLKFFVQRVVSGVQVVGEQAYKFAETQMGEIVTGVQTWMNKKDVPPEVKESLKAVLSDSMVPETKLKVQELKTTLGLEDKSP